MDLVSALIIVAEAAVFAAIVLGVRAIVRYRRGTRPTPVSEPRLSRNATRRGIAVLALAIGAGLTYILATGETRAGWISAWAMAGACFGGFLELARQRSRESILVNRSTALVQVCVAAGISFAVLTEPMDSPTYEAAVAGGLGFALARLSIWLWLGVSREHQDRFHDKSRRVIEPK
jgi:hypothetical protein